MLIHMMFSSRRYSGFIGLGGGASFQVMRASYSMRLNKRIGLRIRCAAIHHGQQHA